MKTGIGAVLAIAGGLGMILGPTLGATLLGRPLSFLAGFVVGVLSGVGVALAISGMLDMRRGAGSST